MSVVGQGVRAGVLPVFALAAALGGCHSSADLEPYDIGIPCPEGENLEPGPVCVPASCGEGPWGAQAGQPGTVYVDVSAEPGGDGSQLAPYDQIQRGLDAAGGAGGGTVALAIGTYLENLEVDSGHCGVHLAGRCSEAVVLDGSAAENGPGIYVLMDSEPCDPFTLSDLTVTRAGDVGIWVDAGEIEVHDVTLVDNNSMGIVLTTPSAVARLEGVEILDTKTVMGSYGYGIAVMDGARLEFVDGRIERSVGTGILVSDPGARAEVDNVWIADTESDATGNLGTGVAVQAGGFLSLRNSTLENNRYAGAYAWHVDSIIELSGVQIFGTSPDGQGECGAGLFVVNSTATVEDCLFEGNTKSTIELLGISAQLSIQDAILRDTCSNAEGHHGYGLSMGQGAELTMVDSTLEGHQEIGLYLMGQGTTADLDNVVIRGTRPSPAGMDGTGVWVLDGAELTADACILEDNTQFGLGVQGLDARADLGEVTIRDTNADDRGNYGYGVEVLGGAELVMEQCTLEDNTAAGMFVVAAGSSATLTDTTVQGTRRPATQTTGVGVIAQDRAHISLIGGSIGPQDGPGLLAISEGEIQCTGCSLDASAFAGAVVWSGVLTMEDASISGTRVDANEGGGIGIYASDVLGPSEVRLQRTHIRDSLYSALWIEGEGLYEIEDCELDGASGMALEYPNGETTLLQGDAIYAAEVGAQWDGEAGLLLSGNTIRGSARAGVLLDHSTATLEGNTFEDNGVDLVQQDWDCANAPPTGVEEVPTTDLCPVYDYMIAPVVFDLYLEGN